ncbi:MAG: 6-hydroxymethylpterin diphosphokinase MptE-like protein [Chloroflexota bacterium]
MSRSADHVRQFYKSGMYRLYVLKKRIGYQLSPAGRQSLQHLAGLKDRYFGERCFIIGNGPSLKNTDLSRLQTEFTFGLNRIYLLYPELGFTTTFLVSINQLVMEQCAQEILGQQTTKFLPWNFYPRIKGCKYADTIFLQTDVNRPGFTLDARRPIWAGATVTYIAMQLAYHMGFEQVVLVGVDHSFATTGKAHAEVVSQGDDPNHFSPEYFGKGFRWHLPDLDTSAFAYRLARQVFESNGRQIVDATIGGKLTVFPKVDYATVF